MIGSKDFSKKWFQIAISLILTTTVTTACTKTVYVTVASTSPREVTTTTIGVTSTTIGPTAAIAKPPVTESPLTINGYSIEPGADLTFAELSEENLSHRNLSGINLFSANLSNANLSWTDLTLADLRQANLLGVNLEHADLTNADLSYAYLNGANLTNANLTNANLACAELSWADLTDTNFTGVTWSDGTDCYGSGTNTNGSQSTSLPDPNRTFMVGEIGPGGGTIFYDAGSVQMWGRYLEVACTGWANDCDGSADPRTVWGCDRNYVQSAQDVAIGSGKTNTEAVLLACPNANAANLAIDYSNNGYEDWFLPSKEELGLLYTNVGIEGQYWCSTAGDGGVTWYQGYNNGCQYYFGASDGSYYVRPVRAF